MQQADLKSWAAGPSLSAVHGVLSGKDGDSQNDLGLRL